MDSENQQYSSATRSPMHDALEGMEGLSDASRVDKTFAMPHPLLASAHTNLVDNFQYCDQPQRRSRLTTTTPSIQEVGSYLVSRRMLFQQEQRATICRMRDGTLLCDNELKNPTTRALFLLPMADEQSFQTQIPHLYQTS